MPVLLRFPIFSLALMLAGACGAPNAVSTHGEERSAPAVERVWPAPPARARIRFVRSFERPADLGIRKSLYQRVVDSLAGQRDEYRFERPTGVAEREGIVYVADPDAQAIWIVDAAHGHFTRVESAGELALVSPVAVCLGPEGTVFVADTGLKKVLILDREGHLVREAVPGGVERPAGVAFDPGTRRLYVADSALDRIFVYRADGASLGVWGGPGTGDGEFNHPTHVSVERDGTVLVTDALNFRIQAFDATGKLAWKFGRHGDGSGDLAAPKGVASDVGGHVYVVDALFDTVQIFDRDGALLLAFGDKGSGPGDFSLPGGLFVNDAGRIYVADGYNHRINVFDAAEGVGER